jgi:hypothetical protein
MANRARFPESDDVDETRKRPDPLAVGAQMIARAGVDPFCGSPAIY